MDIKSKYSRTEEIEINKLQLSEYNTRTAFIDYQHVDFIATEIEKKGFLAKGALIVNEITDINKTIISRRVVAGVHRLHACQKLKLPKVLCTIYTNLSDEEEVYIDLLDNEADESHKPHHFLEIAEHYKFLQSTKSWSIRQISGIVNISKSTVGRRLNVANLPDAAKQIIKKSLIVPHAGQIFEERHFEQICKLCPEHTVTICHEIYEIGLKASKKETDINNNRVEPMKEKSIKERVNELLELEKQGKIITIKGSIEEMSRMRDKQSLEREQLEFDFDIQKITTKGRYYIPNWFNDDFQPKVSPAIFSLYSFLYRKIVGWNKTKDKISLSQMMAGTNLSKATVIECRNYLAKKRLIEVKSDRNEINEITILFPETGTTAVSETKKAVNLVDNGTKMSSKKSEHTTEQNNIHNDNNNTNIADVVNLLISRFGIEGKSLKKCEEKLKQMGSEYIYHKIKLLEERIEKEKPVDSLSGWLINAIVYDYKNSNVKDKIVTPNEQELDFKDKEKRAELAKQKQDYDLYVDSQINECLNKLTSDEQKKLKIDIFNNKRKADQYLKNQYKDVPDDIILYGIIRNELKDYFNIMGFDQYCNCLIPIKV